MKPLAHHLLKKGSLTAKRYLLNIRQTSKYESYSKKRFDFAV